VIRDSMSVEELVVILDNMGYNTKYHKKTDKEMAWAEFWK